jgi:hypothetical protein
MATQNAWTQCPGIFLAPDDFGELGGKRGGIFWHFLAA